eukprot:s10661_g1.t1
MLAKTPQIERPIALLHVVYKAFVKLRWDLVEKWLADVARDALGRGATTDVSLRRLASGEAHRAQGKHHITIFLDISTFYDGIRHEALYFMWPSRCTKDLGWSWPTNLPARRLKRASAYLPVAQLPQCCPRSPCGGPWHPSLPLLQLIMRIYG